MRTLFHSPLLAAVLSLLWVCACVGQEPAPENREPRLVVQIGHSGPVNSVVFSPDEKFLLTGGSDHTARLWDARTGEELLAFRGHEPVVNSTGGTIGVTSVAFAPDGQRVLTGSGDSTARLWDAQTGKELLALKGHPSDVTSVKFSPDGKQLLTGSGDQTARLWDAQTGQELLALKGHTDSVTSVAFSPDGKQFLTGSGDQTARLWDAQTGKELLALKGHNDWLNSVAFAPDGKRVLTGGNDRSARLWDAQTGKELLALKGHTSEVTSVAFAPDSKRVLTGSRDNTARLWDAQTGKELLALKGHKEPLEAVAFAPDGKRVLTGSWDKTARLWDAQTGQELLALKGHNTSDVGSVAFAPDGKQLLTGSGDQTARLWDAQTGKELLTLKGHTGRLTSVAFAPDGKRILTGSWDNTARLWDAQTGQELFTLKGHAGRLTSVAFAPDGKRVLTGSCDHTARLWDTQTGKELLALKGHTWFVNSVAFAPDGKRVLTGSYDKTARLWDARTGKELLTFRGHRAWVTAVAFAPDGKHVLTGTWDEAARLWDAQTGQELLTFKGPANLVSAVVFSRDGQRLLTGSDDGTARLWDAETGKELLALKGHTFIVSSVAFAPDGKQILTGSFDNTARLWDATTGQELCRMISFTGGGWAVVDTAGRYDASNGGDVEGLHWVVGRETIALKQLKERYYDPGLLAKYLGFNKEPLREVAAFRDVKLYPAVAVAQVDPRKPRLDVKLTNRGGGIGRVVVLVNGKELTADARPRGADANAAKLDLQLDLSADPRLVPGQKNQLEVLAYNGDGYLCSRGLTREFDGPGTAAADPPTLQAVIVGVSKYRGERLALRYAAKDAEDFATALRLAAGRFLDPDKDHPERVRITMMTGADADTRPSRANLVKALEALKATKPGDIVVVYLAGHGVTQGGQDGDWHYLTADAQSADLSDPEVRKQVSLSSAELTEFLKASPARKQVLVLDTCHSGRLVEKLTERRDVPGSQVRALERVKDRTGMHVLAGCAADSVSYEATRYGQGLLTYSLLLGMRGAKLREGEYVDVVDLFGYAADKVPELARDIGGVQRPLIASPRGASFDIGRLTAEDRAQVPLQSVKPVLLRAVFQLEKPARDSLGLSRGVNDRLRQASSAARGARLVFVDADEFPGGVEVSGRYKIDGDKVTVSVSLFQGGRELPPFSVEGAAGKPDELAEKIAAEVEKALAVIGGK